MMTEVRLGVTWYSICKGTDNYKGTQELSEVMKMFSILTEVPVKRAKTYRTVGLPKRR